MATRVGLYYFSGTGNTEIVAELIQAAFKRHAAQTDVFKIESILRGRVPLDLDRYDLVGIGHPIHGLDAPRILYEFVDALAPVRGKPAFVFKSAADYIWINNGASKTLIRRLEGKGYHVVVTV